MTREDRAREVLRDAYIAETGNSGTTEAYWYQPIERLEYSDRYAIRAMLQFADAEAAAMRERAAAECERIESEYRVKWKVDYDMHDQGISDGAGLAAEAIRALPATGEVGRG